jgi:FixJ family two-component response regulator
MEVRGRFHRMTPRERDVFDHLINGQLNKQIGFADLVRMAADLEILPQRNVT